jgi:NAD(P)-dependent dehydrogenase (short-subunit alcohol dehydrogenase family)
MSFSRLDLIGRTAVVIGGTSGIGRAIAHGLAEAGADVVCSSRRQEQVDTAAGEIGTPVGELVTLWTRVVESQLP